MHWLIIFVVLGLGCFIPSLEAGPQTNVQMLVPGFTVRELPVRLSNINNLRFTPDGRLSALGYDGRIHVLRDTDGDGLEDESGLFWDKPGLRVPVGMAWTKEGLYVSSQGKVSFLRDTDQDGQADAEEVIASGWPKTDVASGGVDATAVTLDRAGNVYFGLMAADYSNPYRVKDGVSRYDLNSPRGTIQKWSKATRKLETIATGIRVPYTLAFNRHDDLFLTDQEGETWCPGGNPLDELNHIIPGRNYGFPPRHEKHLPNLISEPPVVGFGPQHQSACGFVFNEASAGQRSFGPVWWEGDALVTGQSRGQIWRTRLVQTSAGYLGQPTLIARLNLLTTDVAVSPKGELYVSCHSGPPDWGTGPKGAGHLFQISYTDTNAPQPVAVWCDGPMQVRVAFDRPIDAAATNGLVGREIEFGEYVRAADRFEVLKPPYKVVKAQTATPRGKLRIVSVRLHPGQTLLALTTDPHPQAVTYALTLPNIRARDAKAESATVDLAYSLNGVGAGWRSANLLSSAGQDGWWPHFDSEAARAGAESSLWHRHINPPQFSDLQLRTLETLLQLPAGLVTLRFESGQSFKVKVGPLETQARRTNQHYFATTSARSTGERIPIRVEMDAAQKASPLRVMFFTDTDPTVRPVPFSWLYLPWAPSYQPPPPLIAANTNLMGGDSERGRALFSGERLKCATCHKLRGEGREIGPDLSNLVHRDAASVWRDITEPNASINPDYVAYQVALRDGSELTGFVRAQNESTLRILGADGRETIVPRAHMQEMRASSISAMPSGLLEGLSEEQVRDLLTFLVTDPQPKAQAPRSETKPPAPSRAAKTKQPPPARRRTEVEAILAQSPRLSHPRPFHITLVASRQDHGPGEHDYPAWQTNWARLLGHAEAVTVSTAWKWPAPEQFQQANVLVFYYWNHAWTPKAYEELDAFLARGGGAVMLHAACIADKEPESLAERLGLSAQPVRSRYRHGALHFKIAAPTDHPITRGLPRVMHFVDETYWPLIGDTNKVEVLATADEEGQPWPMLWTAQKGKGRVFGSVLGHYSWTYDDPFFRLLVLRGLAWAAGEETQRFEKLAIHGLTLPD